uniref:Protein containing MFS 1 domain n=1 Tax=Rhipicephalus zambeziensis TaxID=60191 RepID=A0A224Z0G0_9ACAR
MREVAEISRRMSGSKNASGYINGAFFIDPSDEGKKEIENCSADDNTEKEASVASKGVLAVIRQSRWMLPLIYTHIWMSASFSIMQPYFPPLAAAAGLEAWKYGFFFSATKIAMLLGSVLNERLMTIASPRKCYLSGQIGFLLFTILLGLMYWSPGGNIFLGLCLVLALIGGFFSTVYVVSAYTVVTAEFPVHTGLIISTMEFLWGSGSMIGCGISGLLIDAWAYPLPFFVLALLASFSLPWTTRSQRIPDKPLKEVQPRPSSESAENQKNLFRLLIDPVFVVDMVTVMLSWIIMGFNEPTLEPHLRQFGIDTTELGVIFMVQFASYTVAALVLGILCQLKCYVDGIPLPSVHGCWNGRAIRLWLLPFIETCSGKRILRRHKDNIIHFHCCIYKFGARGYSDTSNCRIHRRKIRL